MNVYAKFYCAALRMKKALGIFRELTTTTTTTRTRVAFWDPPSGSKNDNGNPVDVKSAGRARSNNSGQYKGLFQMSK